MSTNYDVPHYVILSSLLLLPSSYSAKYCPQYLHGQNSKSENWTADQKMTNRNERHKEKGYKQTLTNLAVLTRPYFFMFYCSILLLYIYFLFT
jgi:hypothetical protein